MKRHCQSNVLVIVVSIVMVAAAHPARADLGDQLAKLLPEDGAESNFFGRSVAISGATAIVGAYGHWERNPRRRFGSAYLFDTTTGQQIAELLPNDGARHDKFGFSVAISSATAIVGSFEDDDNGTDSGSAYLFDISDPANPVQIAKLLPDDGNGIDWFGYSVAIGGTTAIVGAREDDDNGRQSGSAYLFDISDPANPTQIFKLLPDDGAAEDRFGLSVAISGATAIVGAVWDDDNGDVSGSAYLFDVSTGRQLFKLLPNDGAAGDWFGFSVAICDSIALVGAYRDSDNGFQSGSAYLFDISDPANPTQIAKLLPDDGREGDFFGHGLAFSGETAVVGAVHHVDNGTESGSAYLFDISDPANPTQIFKLLPDDGEAGDWFGVSVAISGATAIVGAYTDDDNGTNSGSAFLFDAGRRSGVLAELTDLTMIDGLIVAGGLPEMESSDDMYFSTLAFETGKASETHRLLYQVRALTAVQNPSTIDITLEGHILDVEADVTLFLKNFNTGLFEQVGQFTNVFGVDTTNTVNIPNASRFVRPNGRIVLRVKKVIILPITIGKGFPSFDDLLEIRVR